MTARCFGICCMMGVVAVTLCLPSTFALGQPAPTSTQATNGSVPPRTRLAALAKWFPGLEVTPQGIRGLTGPNPVGLAKILGEGDGEGHSSKRSALRRSMVVDPPTAAGYNNAYRILQTPDHVVILYEILH